MESLSELSNHLARFFEEGSWVGWAPSEHLGSPVLEANSRYYTLRSSQLVPNDQPFPKDMDPRGFLERGKGLEFAYTEDNLVEFWRYNKDKDRFVPFQYLQSMSLILLSYITLNPREFKNGDIVEAHVSFLMVKMSVGQHNGSDRFKAPPKYRMLVTLRGLTLLARKEHKVRSFGTSYTGRSDTEHLVIQSLASPGTGLPKRKRQLHATGDPSEGPMEVEVENALKRCCIE